MTGSVFDAAGRLYNVDPLLGRAIAMVESGGRHIDPKTGKPLRSSAGALGTMQLMPGTAADVGVDPTVEEQNIHGGMKYFGQMLDQFRDPVKALQAYNAGPNGNWNNPETRAYVGKVAAAYQQLKGQGMAKPPAKADDFSDILDMPVKGAAPVAEEDNSDILDMPTKGAPTSYFTPTQSVGNIPEGDVVGGALNKPVRGDKVPGAVAQAAASFSTDPDQRIRIFATRLFPDMKPEDAAKRFFYEGNRLAAVGADGQPFFVEPDSVYRGDVPIYRQNLRGFTPSFVAQGAGAALPLAGGLVGGAVASPTSLVAGPALAAGGAAVGDAARQFVANRLDPAGGLPYDWWQTGREALLSGAGQAAGAGMARAVAPNALAVPASEIRLARTAGILPAAEAAYDRAAGQGVALTPGQASGLPSLLAYEDVAGRNPLLMDRAKRFYQGQQAQLQDAGQNMLATVSPQADAADAAMMFQRGAGDTINTVRRQANAAARPSYQAAEGAGNVMTPDLAQLLDVPAVQAAMTKARAEYANIYRQPPPDVPDFRLWDLTKRALDDAHGIAARGGDRTGAMAVDSLRGDLSARLDEAFPTYAQARATAAPGQRLAARLEETAAGKVADMTGAENARPILAPMFERSNPTTIRATRDAFMEAGKEAEWYAGVRAYLQGAIDKASMSQDGLNAAMLRRNIWANNDVRKAMQAAMSPEQYEGFTRFMGTIEDVARTMPMNSLTQPRQMAEAALQTAAGNTPANKLVRGIGTLTSPGKLMMGGSIITDKIDAWLTGRNIGQVVDNLFSPNGMKMLEDMARVSPGSNRARATALQILGRATPDLPVASDGTSLPAPQATNPLLAPAR